MKTLNVFAAIVTCVFASPLIRIGELEEVVPYSKNAALLSDHIGLVPMEQAQGRIVGGVVATIEQFPWVVSMRHQGAHRCGGSIISTTRILSVAQCTVDIAPGSLFLLIIHLISNYNHIIIVTPSRISLLLVVKMFMFI